MQFVDISYAIISASAPCGKYDIEIDTPIAQAIGLDRKSVIKTTKIYTTSNAKLVKKIGDLPNNLRAEFKQKYEAYQKSIISKW